MYFQKKIIAIAIVFAAICSCEKKNSTTESNNYTIANSDSTGTNYYHTKRALIHHAQIDVAVNNAIQSTNLIEEKTIALKGFITKSEVQQSTTKIDNNDINKDTTVETRYIKPTALLQIRVPDSSMQAMLQFIQQISTQINSRVINAFDINTTPTNTSNTALNIATPIGSYYKSELADLLNYCTINVTLNAPETIVKQAIVNKNASWLNQSYVSKLKYNLQKGIFGFINVLLFLLQFWMLVPIYFLIKWMNKKYKLAWLLKPKQLKH